MQKFNVIKIFSLLLICVLAISLFSKVGTTTYHAFFADDTFEQGTTIGPIDVSGMTEEEARTTLLSEIEAWYDVGQISIASNEENYVLEKRQAYRFDILKSVNSAISGGQNTLFVNLKDDVYAHLINEFTQSNQQEIETEKLTSGLLQPAVNLHPGEVTINLAQFTKVDEKNVVTQALIINIKDKSELTKWVKVFGIVNIPGNSPFSLATFLTENNALNKYSNETLSVIATGIYSAVLPTNFDIVERHISNQLPPYATFGHEAKFEKEKKDLIIFNQNPYEYKLLFSLTDKGFEVQLVGAEMPQTISVIIQDEESFKPKIIKQFDSTLKKGQVKVKQKGTQARVGKIYRIVKETGQLDQKVLVAQDYYPPIPVIEVQSILAPEEQQQNNPTDQGQESTDPESNINQPSENPVDETEEENRKDHPETDLWEDPDPLHLLKS